MRFVVVILIVAVLLTGGAVPALVWPAGLAFAATGDGLQVEVRGELAGTVSYQGVAGAADRMAGVLSGRGEVYLRPGTSSDWWALLAVEPWVPLDFSGGETPPASVAVTEAHVGLRLPTADVYVGRFGLPLETARLTLPYTLTSWDTAGRRQGVDGIRIDLYRGAGRLQLAAVYGNDAGPSEAPPPGGSSLGASSPGASSSGASSSGASSSAASPPGASPLGTGSGSSGTWTPVLGWRQALAGWEAGGYILWRPSGVAVGVGASGLVGSLVVYGEAWSIADEQGLRYSLGATGYAGDLLWTAELARTPFLPEAPAGVPAPPVPLVAVQLAYPLAPDWFLVVDGRTALDGVGPAGGGPASDGPGSGGSASTGLASGGIEADPGRAHLLSVTLTHEVLPGQLELELGARHGILPPRPAALDMSATARWYF